MRRVVCSLQCHVVIAVAMHERHIAAKVILVDSEPKLSIACTGSVLSAILPVAASGHCGQALCTKSSGVPEGCACKILAVNITFSG